MQWEQREDSKNSGLEEQEEMIPKGSDISVFVLKEWRGSC